MEPEVGHPTAAEVGELRMRIAELEAEVDRLRRNPGTYRLEKDLRQSRAEFRALLSNLAAGIAMINVQGLVTQVNDKFADMLRRRPEEIIGRPLMEFTHAEDVDLSMDRIEGLKRGEIEHYSVEKRYVRKDGTDFWAEACVTGVRDESGELEGLVGVIIDVTGRKQVEDALRRSKGYLEAMFAHLASGVALVDSEGRIIRHNTKFSDMMGYERSELVGRTLGEITYAEDRDRSSDNLCKIAKNDVQSYTIEKRYVRKDGTVFWAEASVTQIIGPDGCSQEYVGVVTDIDHRKQAERQLKQAFESESALSRTDSLTGLGNRKQYNEAASDLWSICRETADSTNESRPLSLILFDIDHFKRINDTYGHPAGDTCLETLARVLKKQIRDDVFCRIGGEEFAILLMGAPLSHASQVADRLRHTLEIEWICHKHPDGSEDRFQVTISLGVATIDGRDHTMSLKDLYSDADKALYQSKRKGRNCVVCCGE